MFLSLKTKIFFLITLILTITAFVIMYFTKQDVGKAMFNAEEITSRNILYLVELNVKAEYNQLLSNKIDTMLKYQYNLKILSNVVMSSLSESEELCNKGIISIDVAKKSITKWFGSSMIRNPDLMIFDQSGLIITHTNENNIGRSIINIEDMKGRQIVKMMSDDVLMKDGDYAVFIWKNPGEQTGKKKLGYFLPFKKWHWTVGAVVDIGDIEAEADKKLNRVIEELNRTFDKIYIGKTGSAFLFNGKKEILIAPRGLKNRNLSSVFNILTKNLLLDDLMKASESKNNSIQYIASIDKELIMAGHVTYFKSLDWYIAASVPFKEIELPAKILVERQIYIIAMIFFASLLTFYIFISRISGPLKKLSVYAKKLSNLDFTKEEDISINIDDLPQKSNDEVGLLAKSFLSMKNELKENIKALMETTAAKERIQGELNVAREIQLGILPKIFPPFPEHDEFYLYAVLNPAKEVGGDLYDFFFIDEKNLCFTLGDVSDKGVPAALFMVITTTLIKTITQKGLCLCDVMSKLNNILCKDNPRSMFVTLIIGVLNIDTGEVKYVNGGHNPPVVISLENGVYYKKDTKDLLVGAFEDYPYKEVSFFLGQGDAFFLYTDGVTEAMDIEKKIFSEERLIYELEQTKDQLGENAIGKIIKEIKLHAGEAPQSDDIAMMMIRYNGKLKI